MLPPRMPNSSCRAAQIAVAPLTAEQVRARVCAWAEERGGPPRLVTYLNAHNLNLAFRHPRYLETLLRADLVYADGMGVVWGWRWLGHPLPERVNAGDFIPEFCREAARRGISLYLLGSKPGVAQAAAERWAAEAPGLKIAAARDGYFSPASEERIAAEIRRLAPGIVLVGMGPPRQEEWAARWAERLGAPVVWCVGALFEYYGGGRSRAPVWMRRCGLEWLWRLALEPLRLGGRYTLGNARFVWNLWKLKRGGAE